MRKGYLLACLSAAALAAGIPVWHSLRSATAGDARKEAGKSATADLLPVAQVVLFSSGVGYFQREGAVEGDQRIDLSFPTQDVNDLIKSLTLRDMDGGRIDAVSYDSNAPVEVTLAQAAAGQPAALTGSVVGIEKKKQQVGKDVVEVECLNLWCADGMRSVKLSDVQRVRFLNAVMDSEFKKALETLALGHDTQKRTVSIQFTGKGRRHVKVGYVIENPIWKTSYRLVLSKEGKDKGEKAKADR